MNSYPVNNITPKKSRKVLTLSIKKEIIAYDGSGLSHREIAKKFGLARSTVTKILLTKQSILQNDLGILNNSWKRIYRNDLNRLEIELAKWCVDDIDFINSIDQDYSRANDIERNTPIKIKDGLNDKMILSKARALCFKMGLFDLDIRKSWLKKFKTKFNLDFEIGNKEDDNSIKNKESDASDNTIDLSLPSHIIKSNVPYDLESSILLNLLNSSSHISQIKNPYPFFEMDCMYNNFNFTNTIPSQHTIDCTSSIPFSINDIYDNFNHNYTNNFYNSNINNFSIDHIYQL